MTLSNALFVSTFDDCGHVPIVNLPVRNVTLGTNGSIKRGVDLSIGRSESNHALQISVDLNNSVLYDVTGICGEGISPASCNTQHGGLFDVNRSRTWAQAADQEAAGAAPEDGHANLRKLPSYSWGSDVVHLNTTTSIDRLPLGIAKDDRLLMNSLGLGRNSTLINSLLETGLIRHRTWSLWWGLEGDSAETQKNGHLILGDASNFGDNNITIGLSDQSRCITHLMVTVSNITMDFANGTSLGILGTSAGSSLSFCINPGYPMITMPSANWEQFAARAGGRLDQNTEGRSTSAINYWGMLYEASGVFDGDLTFTISESGNDFDVRVPNHQLVTRDISIQDSGQIVEMNSSRREVKINSPGGINANDMPFLGMPFLSSVYLMVDYERDQFSLLGVRPIDDEPLAPIRPQSVASCLDSLAPTESRGTEFPVPTVGRKTIPPRSIAGASIGGVIGVTLMIGAAFLYQKHWRPRRTVAGHGVTDGSKTPIKVIRQEHELPERSVSGFDGKCVPLLDSADPAGPDAPTLATDASFLGPQELPVE
ncbi:MAG: hypothetical protein M1817_001873 [Caeruleum heppii]|nr:MAG: hypothetical protein M1817_001873 [Caeruleum heppii]